MLFDSGCVVCLQRRGPVCAECHGLLQPGGDVTVEGMARCSAGFVLDDRSLAIIAALKYRRQRRLARWLATALVDLVPLGADVITWVPATPERRRSRGFDQAHEFARSLGKLTGLPVVGLLTREPDDRRQTGLSRGERLHGPKLAIRGVVPRFVVIADDVITTGSSLRIAASALQTAGSTRVVGVTAAATPGHSRRLSPQLSNRDYYP